jgi:hypothetical protein
LNKMFALRSNVYILLILLLVLVTNGCAPAAPAAGVASGETAAEVQVVKSKDQEPTSTVEPAVVPPTPTPAPQIGPLKITAQGFGMVEDTFWFAFMVENSNKNTAFESTRYTITAYDASDKVIFEKSDSYLGVVYPEQKIGEADYYRLDDGAVAARIEVALMETTSKTTDQAAPLGTDQIVITTPDESGRQRLYALGLVTNRTEYVLDDFRTTVIGFNEAGDIVGGGFRKMQSVPAGGMVGLDILYLTTETSARIEVFPTLLKFHDSASPGDNASNRTEEVSVLNTGYGLLRNELSGYGLIVQNGSANALKAKADVRFYDPDGKLLTSSGLVFVIGPNQELGLGGTFSIPNDGTIGRTEIDVWTMANQENVTFQNYPAEPIAIPQVAGRSKMPVQVSNPTENKIEGYWPIWVVAFDDAGQIIGGGTGFARDLNADSSANFMVDLFVSAVPAKVAAYITR